MVISYGCDRYKSILEDKNKSFLSIEKNIKWCTDPTYNPSYITLNGKDATAMVVVCNHCLACPKL